MHVLNTLPQRLDPGATPTFAGLISPSLTSPAASNLTLATGTFGTALTVASATGNVGIGTTSPSSGKLQIQTTGGAAGFENAVYLAKGGGYGESAIQNYYTDAGNFGLGFAPGGSVTSVVMNAAGNVGIGTTTPATKLDVNGAATFAGAVSGITTLATTGAATFGGAVTSSQGIFAVPDGGVLYFTNGSGTYIQGNNNTPYIRAMLAGVNRLEANSTGVAVTGAVTVSSTTASVGLGTGALQVAGGAYIGGASVFGGAVTAAGFFTGTGNSGAAEFKNSTPGSSQSIGLFNTSTDASSDVSYGFQTQGSRTANWVLSRDSGLLEMTTGYQTRGTVRVSFDPLSGNSVFGGTISPQQATTALAPAYVKGAIYFDTTLNKLRVGGATAYETITSA